MRRNITAIVLLGVCLMLAGAAAAQKPTAPPAPPKDVVQQMAPQPAPAPAPQQPPGMGKWWKDPGMAQVLELSAEQIVQIEQIAFEHRLKLINLRAALETAEVQLEGLLEADHPDEAKVAAQIDQVALARGNVEKQNAMLMLAVRRVITLLQWKRLQAIQQERERRMRPGMPPQPMPNPEGAAPPRPPDA